MGDKLLDKTNELIRNQNEMSKTLHDLRLEVIKAREQNMKLAKENMGLRKQIRVLQGSSSEPIETIKEVPVAAETIPMKKEKLVITPKEKVAPEPKKEVEVKYKEDQKVYKDKSINKSLIYEFFLGKNIIAKIAAVMISLGIFTFGRMAYDVMTDTIRFFFILTIGLIFFIVGHIFNKRDSHMFATTFYGIGLTTILISLAIGGYTYEVLNNYLFYSINFVMIGAVFIYFRDKRGVLLDLLLALTYMTLLVFNSFSYGQDVNALPFTILTIIPVTAIMIWTMMVFYNDKEKEVLPTYLSFTMILTVVGLVLMFLEENNGIYYGIATIIVTYLGNYRMYKKTGNFNVFIGLQTLFTIFFSTFLTYSIMTSYYEMSYQVHLIQFILMIPIYIYLYKDEITDDVTFVDIYFIMLTVFGLAFIVQYNEGLDTQMNLARNIFFLLFMVVYYLATKFTKRTTQYIGLIMVLMTYTFILFNIMTFIHTISFEYTMLYLPIGLFTVGLLVADKIIDFKGYAVENKILTYTIRPVAIIGFVITMLMITNELKDLVDPRYNIIYLGTIIYYVVIFKHIFTIKFFEPDKESVFKNIINVAITLLVITVNFIYFDHDFSKGVDVFTFFIILLPNIYIIWSLREVYTYLKTAVSLDIEWIFIGIYKLGVVIQSLFIHYYINVTYDKIILSSYFMIVAAIGVLFGFRERWKRARYIGLAAIYFSFIKFFVYDFFKQDLTDGVKVVTYITLGVVLMGISFLYSQLEKTYGGNEVLSK